MSHKAPCPKHVSHVSCACTTHDRCQPYVHRKLHNLIPRICLPYARPIQSQTCPARAPRVPLARPHVAQSRPLLTYPTHAPDMTQTCPMRFPRMLHALLPDVTTSPAFQCRPHTCRAHGPHTCLTCSMRAAQLLNNLHSSMQAPPTSHTCPTRVSCMARACSTRTSEVVAQNSAFPAHVPRMSHTRRTVPCMPARALHTRPVYVTHTRPRAHVASVLHKSSVQDPFMATCASSVPNKSHNLFPSTCVPQRSHTCPAHAPRM